MRHDSAPPLSGAHAAEVVDALPDITAVLDASGTIITVNRAWRMFALDNGGRPEATGVGVNYLDVCERAAAAGCPEAADVMAGLEAVLTGQTIESDREYPCPSPEVGRWFNSRIVPLSGATRGAVVSHENITRRKTSERQLEYRASHDPLTGLANRLLFTDRLKEALRHRPDRSHVANVGVLYIDLDKFKHVNDTYGHDVGDEVLLHAASGLRSGVRTDDTVGRLGGDEFAVCAPSISEECFDELTQRVRAALDKPYRIHGRPVRVGGSVGAYLAAPGESVAEALRLADDQMYLDKKAGGYSPVARQVPAEKPVVSTA
jgi:diguanylate cyclase (GGDEF)-like protein